MMYHKTNIDATMENNSMNITEWYTEKIICFSVQGEKNIKLLLALGMVGTST